MSRPSDQFRAESGDARQQIVNLLQKTGENECMEPSNVDVTFYLRKRYFVMMSIFISWMFLHLMRVNLSISLVDMTSKRSVIIGNQTLHLMPEYQWSTQEVGMILSAFSWGYMFAPLGALVANKFGGAIGYGVGTSATGLLTILTPLLIDWDLRAYLVARVLEGAFEGFSNAVYVEVLRLWSTPAERSRAVAGVSSGGVFGLMLGYPVCGTIAYYLKWRAVFYITGGASLIWSIIWFSLIRNCPAEDKLMTSQERRFLMHVNRDQSREKVAYPWRKILKSKSLWAYLNDRFVESWSTSFLKYCLPLYIKDVHDVSIKEIGLISGIPHFCAIVGLIGGSVIADYLRNSKLLGISSVHKLYIGFAQVTAIILLITVALWKNFFVSIICFSIFRLLFVFCVISYHVLPVDIGGPYSATIHGLGYTFLGLGSSLNHIVMGSFITDHSITQWSKYFLILSLFNLWGGVMFLKYGSGELEPWAASTPHQAHCEQPEEKEVATDKPTNKVKITDVKFYKRKRYLVTIFVFFGWITLYLMRMNLSICLVEMTSNKTINIGNKTVFLNAEYNFSSKEQGFILSVFSWGYMLAPSGALVASRIGAVKTFGIGIALTALLTIATPLLISWHFMLYAFARIFEGIFEGFTATTAVEILRVWSTPAERARIIGGTASGYVVGTMLGFPLSGTIAYSFGWKAVFYITGGICLTWSILWFCVVRSSPETDGFITLQEQKFLQQGNQQSVRKVIYPWKKIFTSKPVWAFWNDRFVEAWSTAFLIYCLPIYIKDVHDVNIQDIGLLSAIPHVCGIVGIIGGSALQDYLRNNHGFSISNIHRIYLSVAQLAALVLLITAALWRNFLVNIICFSLFRLLFSICIVSYQLIPVDMAGQYSCFIVGVGYTFISVGYALGTVVMGIIVTEHTVAQWSMYFLVLSAFNLWGAIIFFKFGSGKLQPWAIDGVRTR